MSRTAWVYYHLFLLLIIAANVAINMFGAALIGALIVPWGTFFAGATFVIRDLLHRHGGHTAAVSAIIVGAAISYGFSNPALALASGIAFLAAELVDMVTFVRMLQRRSIAIAVLVSGIVGTIADTTIFLPWSGIPMTAGLVAGQIIIKSALSCAAALWIWRWSRLRPQKMHEVG